jgi:hypothetical protein
VSVRIPGEDVKEIGSGEGYASLTADLKETTRASATAVCHFVLGFVLPAQGQNLDLAQFGLGPITPVVAELDGDPNPIEWIAWTQFALWVINPTTLCKSMVTVDTKDWGPGAFIVSYVQRIARKDRLVLSDIDTSDGSLPASVYNISSPCYPAK